MIPRSPLILRQRKRLQEQQAEERAALAARLGELDAAVAALNVTFDEAFAGDQRILGPWSDMDPGAYRRLVAYTGREPNPTLDTRAWLRWVFWLDDKGRELRAPDYNQPARWCLRVGNEDVPGPVRVRGDDAEVQAWAGGVLRSRGWTLLTPEEHQAWLDSLTGT